MVPVVTGHRLWRPAVTVVIIFCNEEIHLAEAVDSVFSQTFTDWELILVDDGSTDRSSELARTLAADNPGRVRHLQHPGHRRRGMSASRNLGVEQAAGRFVAYLDADDRWLPDKLQGQLALMNRHTRAAAVYGPLIRWRSWAGPSAGDDDLYGIHGQGFTLETGRLYEPPELVAHFVRHKDLVPSGALIRRDAIVEVGGGDDSFTDNYEDAVVFAKIGLRQPIYCGTESWYLYRQYPTPDERARRLVGRPDADRPRGAEARSRFLDWLEDHIADHDITEPLVDAALRDARRQIDHPRRHRVHRLLQRSRRAPARLLHDGRKVLDR